MCLKDIVCEVNSQVAQNIGLVSNSPPTLDVPPSATGRGKSDKLSWQQVATNPKYHKPWLTNVDCKVDTQSKRVYVPFDHIKSFQCKLDLPIKLGHNIRLFKAIKSR